ncbi:hypothetical protein [Streptomyces sp. x-19]|uniref:hypothetical protein n=1 Tax=Streptomyces sp. x-19 TaxID=2789280 RepID=UPI00397FEE3D
MTDDEGTDFVAARGAGAQPAVDVGLPDVCQGEAAVVEPVEEFLGDADFAAQVAPIAG